MVVIKDMDMPEKCQECNFEYEEENYYGDTMYYYCPYIYKGYTDDFRDNKRHEECPLSAFEPCEDAISRQAAIDELNKLDVSDGIGISSIACDLQEKAIRSIENLSSAYYQAVCNKKVQQ